MTTLVQRLCSQEQVANKEQCLYNATEYVFAGVPFAGVVTSGFLGNFKLTLMPGGLFHLQTNTKPFVAEGGPVGPATFVLDVAGIPGLDTMVKQVSGGTTCTNAGPAESCHCSAEGAGTGTGQLNCEIFPPSGFQGGGAIVGWFAGSLGVFKIKSIV